MSNSLSPTRRPIMSNTLFESALLYAVYLRICGSSGILRRTLSSSFLNFSFEQPVKSRNSRGIALNSFAPCTGNDEAIMSVYALLSRSGRYTFFRVLDAPWVQFSEDSDQSLAPVLPACTRHTILCNVLSCVPTSKVLGS